MDTIYRKRRRRTDLSQIEVANYLGISYDRYCLIERGDVKMPARLIDKFNEIMNKSKGETTIDRINREQEVNKWWKEVSKREKWGTYGINKYLKEFNIDDLKELGMLLGYTEKGSGIVSNWLRKPNNVSYNSKNKLYSFFEDELNIQPPKPKYKKEIHKNRGKFYSKMNSKDKQEIYNWYENFDFKKWYDEHQKDGVSIQILADSMKLAPNTIRAMLNKNRVVIGSATKLKNFIDNYGKELEETTSITLTPVDEKEIPQQVKDDIDVAIQMVNEAYEKEKQENQKEITFRERVVIKYSKQIDSVDNTIETLNREIKGMRDLLAEKERYVKELNTQKAIYIDFINTINNDEIGE